MKLNSRRACMFFLSLAFCLSFAFAQMKRSSEQQRHRLGLRPGTAWDAVDPRQLMRDADADGDGVITREEWEQFFRNHDNNKDGRLTSEEVPQSKSWDESDEAASPDYGRTFAFERLDGNKNDVIERSEWPGTDRAFKRMDGNRDGVLSREEFMSRNGRFWNELFKNLDFDGDRLISHSEWLDSDSSFQRLDRDGNGVVDEWEFYNPR
jgi:Ca2+-binding EF-hand superfamily protein